MSPVWLDQWLGECGAVSRRAKADVEKKNGGGGASTNELVNYLQGRDDGPFTLLEIEGFYVIVRSEKPVIVRHLGDPSMQ